MIIKRQYLKEQTVGQAIAGEYEFKTLELPWKDNDRRISCIPEGTYQVVKRNSSKYGHHFHVLNVEGRDMILIHHGNYVTDTHGCILVGRNHVDIDQDGLKDVTHSRETMADLNTLLPDSFELIIMS